MPDASLLSEITTAAEQLKRHKDSPLTATVPYLLPIYNDCLDRLEQGRGLHLDMWRYLFDVLISPKFPTASFWRDTHQSHPLSAGERAFRLKSQRTSLEGQKCCWAIQEFNGGTNVVKEYRLRTTYGDGMKEAKEVVLGIPTWTMGLLVHQETPLDQLDRVPFEDAVIFDILIDLVTGNFEPHTKTIDDGPSLQLEILQLLEKAQQEAIEAADMASGNRKLSMQERLDGKRKKIE